MGSKLLIVARPSSSRIVFIPTRSPSGPRGLAGKSAYQLAVDDGYEGTADQFLPDLRSETRVTVNNANYTITAVDRIVEQIGTLSADRTWTLPGIVASGLPDGHKLKVSDKSGTASRTNTLTITAHAGESITGGDLALDYPNGWATLIADATAHTWSVLSPGAAIDAMPSFTSSDPDAFPVTTDVDPDDADLLLTTLNLDRAAKYTDNDLLVPEASRDPDEPLTVGGTIDGVGHIHIVKDYTQNVGPTDYRSGTSVLVEWNAIINDDDTDFFGPNIQPGFFGPAGAFQIQGELEIRKNQTFESLLPLGWVNQLWFHNDAGNARNMTPGWGFLHAPWLWADGASVNLRPNDTTRGGAAFIDNTIYFTKNGGALTREAMFDLISYTSVPHIQGDVTMDWRVAYDVEDLNGVSWNHGVADDLTPQQLLDASEASFLSSTVYPSQGGDARDLSLAYNCGLRVPWLLQGDHRIGVWNESGTAHPPFAFALPDGLTDLPIHATSVNVTPASDVIVTTGKIPDGVEGQVITYVNTSSSHWFLVQDDQVAHRSNVRTGEYAPGPGGRAPITWNPGEAVTLRYGADGLWHVLNRSTVGRDGLAVPAGAGGISMVSFFGAPALGMTDDSTSGADLQFLYRQDADWWHLQNAGFLVEQTSGGATVKIGGDATYPTVLMYSPGESTARLGLSVYFVGSNQPALFMSDGGVDITKYGWLIRGDDYEWDLIGPELRAQILLTVRTVTGSTTLTRSDSELDVNSASAATITVPLQATVHRPTGATVRIRNRGAGTATIAPVSGSVTLEPINGSSLTMLTGETRPLFQRATNIWEVTGAAGERIQTFADADATVAADTTTIFQTTNPLTATRALTMPAASSRPAGATLRVVDYGATPTNQLNVTRAGSDTIMADAFVNVIYGIVQPGTYTFVSDGVSKWTPIKQAKVIPRVTAGASAGTITPDANSIDMIVRTAQSVNITAVAAPTGTPYDGQTLTIRIKSDSTIRTIGGWNAIYRAPSAGPALPTATVASKTLYVQFMYNATDTKWDLILGPRDYT